MAFIFMAFSLHHHGLQLRAFGDLSLRYFNGLHCLVSESTFELGFGTNMVGSPMAVILSSNGRNLTSEI